MFVQGTMDQGQPGSCDQLEFPAAKELSSHARLSLEMRPEQVWARGYLCGGPVRELRRAPDRDGAGDIGHRQAHREQPGIAMTGRAPALRGTQEHDARMLRGRLITKRPAAATGQGQSWDLQILCSNAHRSAVAFGVVLEKPPSWGSTAERELCRDWT